MWLSESFSDRSSENFETTKRIETTPDQVQDISNSFKIAKLTTERNYQTEALWKQNFDNYFTKNLDKIWQTWEVWYAETESKPKESVKPVGVVNPEEVKQTRNEGLSEKEKVKQYGTLANLSYAKFEKIDRTWETSLQNLKVKEASLDIASIDFTKFDIDSNGNLAISDLSKLSPDERFILAYLKNQDGFKDWSNRGIAINTNDRNISDVIDVALFRNKQELSRIAKQKETPLRLADASTTLSDAGKWYGMDTSSLTAEEQKIQRYTDFIEANRPRLSEALVKLKENKTSEYRKQFENFQEKWDFKVLAYYPEEWSKDTGWFQCVLFEKDGKKILSIAWTQITDIWDLKADFAILFWNVPETQTKRMIDFFRNNLKWNDSVTIVGHSLWGTLSQIGSSIYTSAETYTFNSPGAKELKVSIKEWDDYEKEFGDFTNNRKSDIIDEKITNVKWSEGFSFIAEKGVDIWKYRIDVKTSSHSISAIIEAIRNVERLEKYNINDKKYIESPININP